MDAKINLDEKLALLDRPFVLGIVGYFNDYKLRSSWRCLRTRLASTRAITDVL